MRNLKKLLALVLAMVMTFSLMLSASAVDFDDYQDKDSITAEFEESVAVLTGLKVMQGDEKGFRPSDKITRAEAAAVIYRAVTGDVTDRQSALYKDYSTFTDVKSDDWFAGYVGYCQNAGYIKGTSPTTFQPYGQVTGYEVLAMILRAVGYGKNNEFVGSSWQVNVAALAKQLGVTRNVVAAHMDQTLNMAAPREVVADLIFMTIATVPTVTYTPALSYSDKQTLFGQTADVFNPTLGQKTFGLFYSTNWQRIDEWGRPGYYWWKNGVWNGANASGSTGVAAVGNLTTVNTGLAYVNPIGHPLYNNQQGYTNVVNTGFAITTPAAEAWREENLVATIAMTPSYETKTQVRECDVAHELGIPTEDTFRLYVNGTNGVDRGEDAASIATNGAINNNYRIVATDTVTRVGGQGRVSEFYYQINNPWFQQPTTDNWAVMVDTMLAQVTTKNDAKLDKNNHVIVPAQLEVTIWDGANKGASAIATTASKRIIQKEVDDATNWDDYSKGDYILVNAYTDKSGRTTNATRDSAAFETNKVIGTDTVNNILTVGEDAWVIQKAESLNGKQSVVYWNQGKHQVDGKDYDDQLCLFMDKAGTNTGTTYTWYFDQFGNLIGVGDASASRYGVITSVYAAISTNDSDTSGRVKAVASVTYTDGTTGTVTVDSFLASRNAVAIPAQPNGTTGTTATAASDWYTAEPDTRLTATANTIELLPVYDESGHPAMSVGIPTVSPAPTSTRAAQVGWLYMAPSASTNTNNHFGNTANQWDKFGILYNTMFEFVTASDETVVAVATAGDWDTVANSATYQSSLNTGMYVDKANGKANVDDLTQAAATNTARRGMVYKALGYMAVNTPTGSQVTTYTQTATNTDTIAATAYLDNDTQILLRSGRTLTPYTLETLPSNITMASGAVPQWADVDGDGRIDYLYVEGTVAGTVTYNLFYYNGGAAQWNGTEGTIEGYLDGGPEATTITFRNQGLFNAVNNSLNTYDGHLFALQITNDVVSAVMHKAYQNAATPTYAVTRNILMDSDQANGVYALANRSGKGVLAPFNTLIGTATTATSRYNNAGTMTTVTTNGTDGNATAILTSPQGANDAIMAPVFGLGSANGNSYTTNTRAVYYRDSVAIAGALDNLSYVRVSNGWKIDVTGAHTAEYWISPSAKIVGQLDWLNQYECDVTIVYENSASNAATQVYITPDPDVTPVNPTQIVAGTAPFGAAVRDGGTTSAAMQTSLANAAANTLVFGGNVPAGAVAVGSVFAPGALNITNVVGGSLIANNLFFPFSVPSGGALGNVTVNLAIRNSNGVLVYSENNVFNGAGTLGGDQHVFSVDFSGAVNNAGTASTTINAQGVQTSFSGNGRTLLLAAGETFSFAITTVSGTMTISTLSSGNFTMA